MLLRRLETSLLQDTIERADWHVHPEFPGHRNRAGLNRMLKLAVTTLRPNVVPPVLLDKSNCVSDLHVTGPLPSHNDEVERRGREGAKRRCLIQIIDSLLGSPKMRLAIARTDC